jgi:dihydroorotate dehydrogenase (NAD+) catalytic subunit
MVNISVELGNFLKLKNPIMPASGVYGFGREYSELYSLDILGALVTKATTLYKRDGNKTPRIVETPMGVINSIGLENPGVEKVVQEELPFLSKYDVPVIVNIAGSTFDEYIEVANRISQSPHVHCLELNVSCPNVKEGSLAFGTCAKTIEDLTKEVVNASRVPVIVKLSPNVTDIVTCAMGAQRGGANGVSLINTLKGMSINIKTGKPVLANVAGGLSGPAVKPLAVRMVWEVSQAVDIPVIGMGGIASPEDVIEFMMAGASSVAVGTASLSDPYLFPKLIKETKGLLDGMGINNISEIIGLGWKNHCL